MIRATLPGLRIFVLGLMTIGAVPACHTESRAPLTPASGTRVIEPQDGPLTDAQIVGVLGTASSNELQQARIALRRARNRDVLALARTLIAHHEKAANDARALGTRLGLVAETSAPNSDLRSSNTGLVVALSAAKRIDFERTFVVAQIGNYEEILAVLDARLIPAARNGELKEFLQSLRPVLESHLVRALEIREKLPE